MLKFKGLLSFCALMFMCTTVSAGDLSLTINDVYVVIDSKTIPSDKIESITVFESGQININTSVPYDIEPSPTNDGVAITDFSASSETVDLTDIITFSWTTERAASCEATGGVDGWNGSNIDPLPIGDVDITAATVGEHQFTLKCTGSDANDIRFSSVTVNINDPEAVTITSFTANPDSQDVDGAVELSWNTAFATECKGINGTGNWSEQVFTADNLPNGNFEVTVAEAGVFDFVLECTGETGGPVQATERVTVTAPDSCVGKRTLSKGTVIDWPDLYYYDFPLPRAAYKTVTISATRYYSVEFRTPPSGSHIGSLLTIEKTSTAGRRTGTVSQCEGDFSTSVPDECRYVWGASGGILWSTDSADSDRCVLDPDTTYYFNVTFNDGLDPATTTCEGDFCQTILRPVNNY